MGERTFLTMAETIKVACIGAGYVGGSTMAMMAWKCPNIIVTCLDLNLDRIAAWNSDELPIHEPGLLEIVQEVRGTRLFFKGPMIHSMSLLRLISSSCVSTRQPRRPVLAQARRRISLIGRRPHVELLLPSALFRENFGLLLKNPRSLYTPQMLSQPC